MPRDLLADDAAGPRDLFADDAKPMPPKKEKSLGQEIGSYLRGIHNGLYAIPQGAMRMAARGSDALGLSDNAYGMVSDLLGDKEKDKFDKGGDFLGSAIGTLPLVVAKPFVGGAMTGAALSESPDLKGAAVDTGIGGALGKAGDLALRGAPVVASKIGNYLKQYETAAAPIAQEIKAGVNSGGAVAQANREKLTTNLYSEIAQSEAAKQSRIAKALQIVSKNQNPEVTTIGTVRNPSEIGAPLQSAALQNEAAISAQRSALDNELRTAREAIVADNEAKGVTIASTPTYKALVEKLRPVVDGDVTGPAIAKITDPSTKRLYERIWETVVSKDVPLTLAQYRAAERAGVPVKTSIGKNGEEVYSRRITPSFDAVDDARRFLGEVFSGRPPAGYEGISATHKKELYSMLDKIQKEYVGETQGALQKNWRDAAARLEVFDTKAGKTLTATQGDTDALRTNAADIPGQFFGKGADRLQQLQDVTGNADLVSRSAGDWVASQLSGKTAAQVADALGPQRKLADMLAHPTLAPVARNTSAFVRALNASERTAGRAATEGKAAEQAQKTAAALRKQTESAQAAARAAGDAAHARAAKYDRLAPRDVVSSAKTDIANDLKAGRITQAQHDDIYRKIDEADALHGKTDKMRSTIKKIIVGGAIIGAPATVAKTAHLGGL